MAEFMAGRGTTALGIIGTVLGSIGTAAAANGGLANLLGGNANGNHCCHENMPVNRYELGQEQTIAKLQAEKSLLEANTYNDQKLLEVYKYFDGQVKEIRATICENDKALSVSNAKIEGTFAVLGEKIAAQRNEFMCALNRERDERCCGDNSIVNYANATFYPKMVADVTTGTTTVAQTVYNPLPNCGCGCNR
jgi:hypothetical protein